MTDYFNTTLRSTTLWLGVLGLGITFHLQDLQYNQTTDPLVGVMTGVACLFLIADGVLDAIEAVEETDESMLERVAP